MMWSQLSKAFLIAAVFSSSAIVLIPRHILKSAQRERDRYNKHSRSLFLQLIQIRSLSFIGACIQATATALLGLAELAFVLASVFPSSSVATYVLSFLKAPPASASLSPLFLLGVVTALTGTTIRLMCFRELGPLFTFVLTIRDGHKLITSGPYALVRHPSYTGLALAFMGMTLCEVAPSSWLAEADVMHSGLGRVIVGFWVAYFAMVVVVGARAPMEDKMLQREFGREWEEYARRVRYRFVPGIL